MASDRRRDGAGGWGGRAVGDPQIELRDLARGEGAREAGVGGGRARHHQDAARPLVQPVDDAGPARPSHAGHLGVAVEEMVGEGAGGAAGARMDGQARRLVEHHDLGVLMEHVQVPPLGEDPLLLELRRGALDAIARGERSGGLGRAAVHPHETAGDPALDLVAGRVETGGHVAVEPLARRRRLDGPAHSGTGAAAVGSGDSWCRGRKLSIAISTMPTEMALSATLKEGQWWRPT
jgi:hypothetical protein